MQDETGQEREKGQHSWIFLGQKLVKAAKARMDKRTGNTTVMISFILYQVKNKRQPAVASAKGITPVKTLSKGLRECRKVIWWVQH